MKLSVATVFLEAEGDGLDPNEGAVWDPRSTLPGDLPPGINALRVPRAANAHAPILPRRYAAPRVQQSFPADMLPEGSRGRQGYLAAPSIDLHEVQEY